MFLKMEICFIKEDNINFLKMEDYLNFMKIDDLIYLGEGRHNFSQ